MTLLKQAQEKAREILKETASTYSTDDINFTRIRISQVDAIIKQVYEDVVHEVETTSLTNLKATNMTTNTKCCEQCYDRSFGDEGFCNNSNCKCHTPHSLDAVVEEIDWLPYLRSELYQYIDGQYHDDKDINKHCQELALKIEKAITTYGEAVRKEGYEDGVKQTIAQFLRLNLEDPKAPVNIDEVKRRALTERH